VTALAGAGAGSASALQKDDNVYYSISSQSWSSLADYYATVSGLPASPSSLTAVWTAKTTVTCSATTYAYNWATSTWTSLDLRTLNAGSEVTVSRAVGGTLANYVSNGTMRVRLRCSRSTAGIFTVSTDALRVDYS
jgi:hypothetical protein